PHLRQPHRAGGSATVPRTVRVRPTGTGAGPGPVLLHLRRRRGHRLSAPPGDQGPGRSLSAVLGMIWAQARGGVIGRENTLPWHLPEDLAHFKATTAGHPVIMGRKQWQSLPERFRPLPRRRS